MANVSRINGFKPVKHLNGSAYNGSANWYEIPVGDGTATFIGDLVAASNGTPTDNYPTCVRLASSGEVTTGLVLGAIMGMAIDPTNLNTPQYRAASVKKLVLVADSPDLIFECQDGATVATPATSLGLNTGVAATAGDTTTGLSNMTTGPTAATTTNALPLKIVGFKTSPDNTSASASQRLLVMINQHYLMGGQTAV